MDQEPISLRITFFLGFFIFFCVAIFFLIEVLKTETTVVFCDVGQGDSTYIRIENNIDILIDAGPDKKVLSCLGKYMPFYDREIEYAFLSHPQKDHYGGFTQILDRYTIQTFVVSYFQSESKSFKALLQKLKQKDTRVLFWYAKSEVTLTDSTSVKLIWPTKSFINNTVGKDPNIYSQMILLNLDKSLILFTGDISAFPQLYLIKEAVPISILKVPHHGSRNGLTQSFFLKLKPKISVISVGKNNSYGHPSPSILEMLKRAGTTIRRTDLEGDIKFIFK